jgi:Protein of unknown function (DUF2637)
MSLAFATVRDTRSQFEPAMAAGVDRTIRVSTAVAVLAVAAIAAYVSYWHAYAVVCAHGESGVTARLEPVTIDGLVYASSMVNLYAARHRLPVPVLARWLLALGIAATLAANMAQGWSRGPVGAVIAAWPAVSLVGSYELLVWIIRTAAASGPDRVPAVDHAEWHANHPGTDLLPGSASESDTAPENHLTEGSLVPVAEGSPWQPVRPSRADGWRTGSRCSGPPTSKRGPGPGRLRASPARWRGTRVECRRGQRLPAEPRNRAAAFGAQARRPIRQDLAAVGT